LFIVLGIVVIIVLGTVVVAYTSKQRGGAMGVLIDISPSSQGAQQQVRACATTASAQAVRDGALLSIAPVTSAPVYMSTAPIESKLSLGDRLTSSRAKKIRKSATADFRIRIDVVMHGTMRKDSSDTLAATAIMARTLQQQPSPRTLVVCGDAHQVGPGFNVYRERLTPERSRALIASVAPDLADTRGIDVAFGAAGLDTASPFPNAREKLIERWWTHYWRDAVHARTMTYGSTLRFGS